MNAQLLQTLLNDNQPINITLSLGDLKSVVSAILHEERRRIEESQAKRQQIPTLTKREAAELLGVSESTIMRLVASEELKAYKIRNKVRFKQSDIDTYLEENRKYTKQ